MLRQRGERLERPNAHLYETGGMRRVYLRGHANILKRLLVQACGFNLGFLMRKVTGVGTPRSLQSRGEALVAAFDRRAERFLAACGAFQGRHFARVAGSGPDWAFDVASSTWTGRATQRPFRHGLLGWSRRADSNR